MAESAEGQEQKTKPASNPQPIEDFDRAVGGPVRSRKDASMAGSRGLRQGTTSTGAHPFDAMPAIAAVSMNSPAGAACPTGNPGGDSVSSGTSLPASVSNQIASPSMDAGSLFDVAAFPAGYSIMPSTYPEVIEQPASEAQPIGGTRLFGAGETWSPFTTPPWLLNPSVS